MKNKRFLPFILIAVFIPLMGAVCGLSLGIDKAKTDEPPMIVITATSEIIHINPTVTIDMPQVVATSTPKKEDVGSTIFSSKDGMKMVYVPEGQFIMGSPEGTGNENEHPQHAIFLDAFWIDQTEVTNGMYALCVQSGSCQPPHDSSSASHSDYHNNSQYTDYPVIYTSWNDAQAYCAWVDARLPTEAEWEKAARGTDERTYPWGNSAPNTDLLNFDRNIGDTTTVGNYPTAASPYGVWDMAGNVDEWVADWFGETYYSSSPESNPTGPSSGEFRVFRGGSWHDPEYFARSAYRGGDPSDYYNIIIGFRCARSTTPSTTAAASTQSQGVNSTETPPLTQGSTGLTNPDPVVTGSNQVSPKDGMNLLFVSAGDFLMGSPSGVGEENEHPQRTVYLDAFLIDQTEVTNGMYQKCVSTGACTKPYENDSDTHNDYYTNTKYSDHPVIWVNWEQAKTYCEWVDRRLPTEAEWEKAARGTSGQTYPWGNQNPDNNLLNYNQFLSDTSKVGSFPKGISPYGALDLAGNVWEWTADWLAPYPQGVERNPAGPSSGDDRVVRGGSQDYDANHVRAAFRTGFSTTHVDVDLGFRCAVSVKP